MPILLMPIKTGYYSLYAEHLSLILRDPIMIFAMHLDSKENISKFRVLIYASTALYSGNLFADYFLRSLYN